jgi:mRNA-degrading endonuclease RelE of RelBE toxin-antitoxin system
MALVTLSPEAVASFRRLPPAIRIQFDRILVPFGASGRLRFPGPYPVQQLEGAPNLWTLRIGTYRGIFRWDGHEVRFVRFGPRRGVYQRLPKRSGQVHC